MCDQCDDFDEDDYDTYLCEMCNENIEDEVCINCNGVFCDDCFSLHVLECV